MTVEPKPHYTLRVQIDPDMVTLAEIVANAVVNAELRKSLPEIETEDMDERILECGGRLLAAVMPDKDLREKIVDDIRRKLDGSGNPAQETFSMTIPTKPDAQHLAGVLGGVIISTTHRATRSGGPIPAQDAGSLEICNRILKEMIPADNLRSMFLLEVEGDLLEGGYLDREGAP